jgi:hypothetical protein
MTNMPNDQKFAFGTELAVAAPFTAASQLLGTITNEPVVIIFKNQSNVPVFVADNAGATNGSTLVAGENMIIECRANKGVAINGGWPIGTSFFITGSATSTGSFRATIVYAY